ncbi:Conserved hypothetical protein. Putative magnesium transporter [Geotrichum candidum]|uniref:ER membrane protein complex subunit 5 n=1 Tax=Geotrichum candidum TaxID=1173061 RepID=A0A0J9XBV9_GEOCN|nr:Conserved hypothetical protein. Putative magnesium transporter [Geotrichum candidum]
MSKGSLVNVLFFLSTVLIIHSAYSAYEFSYFVKHFTLSTTLNSTLPLDIKIELGLGVLVATLAAVYKQADTLKPIKLSEAIIDVEVKGESPFLSLERRSIFSNILEKRKEYNTWMEKESSS